MKFFSSIKQQALNFLEPYKEKGPATYAAAEQAIGAILITDGIFGIDNPFGAKKRPGIFGTLTGMILAIVFILVPGFIGTMTNIKNMTEEVSAIVVSVGDKVRSVNSSSGDGGGTCGLAVRYMIDGQEYSNESSMSSTEYCALSVGQKIIVNYDPNKPESWAYGTKTVNTFLSIIVWLAIFALIGSIITFFIRLFSIIFGWKLLKDGRKNAAILPPETNIGTIINEIKQNFIASVFGFGGQQNTAVPGNIPSLLSSLTK